jgi:ubiquinone biosynthesis accessory factor UbiJ
MSKPVSPFSLLEDFAQKMNLPLTPPAWLVEESHRRLVLLINHVLQQEPQAMQRLVRQKGRVILAQWRVFTFKVVITPAGLFDLAAPETPFDLCFRVSQESPLDIAASLLQGQKPSVHIEGDVQLAADINWLVDHVRWDLEEDMARLLGDVPAHTIAQAARSFTQALRTFVQQLQSGAKTGGSGR